VNKWLGSIQAGRAPHAGRTRVNTDLVEQIAADLIGGTARGTERKLLSKSLQEAMYYAVRFETNLDYNELNARLSQYLHRWGTRTFIIRFLSLFFFNFIRFHTSESLRALAKDPAEFEQFLGEIDLVCHRRVASVWRSFEKTNQPLDLRAAKKLVSDIEQRLRDD
jgi:hypothetical protein